MGVPVQSSYHAGFTTGASSNRHCCAWWSRSRVEDDDVTSNGAVRQRRIASAIWSDSSSERRAAEILEEALEILWRPLLLEKPLKNTDVMRYFLAPRRGFSLECEALAQIPKLRAERFRHLRGCK